ncbi:hypothetical protein DM860_015015 [Cuscuta australis]|uniref:Uncharacterized protein n=1 Tax=Cuscuta australis TaxID=267555 RepID=A0A328DEZ0_9ASTE|nr:hypothetical protein DM860_015015 [Cuscuta australis]
MVSHKTNILPTYGASSSHHHKTGGRAGQSNMAGNSLPRSPEAHRSHNRTRLDDNLIRPQKCDLSSKEFWKAIRLARPTVHRSTLEDSVFDAPSGFFAVYLKSIDP